MKYIKHILGFITACFVLLLLSAWLWGGAGIVTSGKILLNTLFGYSIASPNQQQLEHGFVLADGFKVSLYATGLGKARMLQMTRAGDLIVSQPRLGKLTLISPDRNDDGLADAKRDLLTGLQLPHGLELIDGWLYVAESQQIGRVAFDEQRGEIVGEYQILISGLNDSGNHWTKSLRAGADGWMYVSSGSSCNVCIEADVFRAAISRFPLNVEAPSLQLFATGLRNSVGMDWSPWEQALYATDNGRDLLGDDFPPCELNKVSQQGFYGWPYINGDGVLDPDMGEGHESLLKTAISPVHGFRAHNAPLGMRFLQYGSLPEAYQKTALVALHGSWNRSTRDGYKVVSLHWQDDGSVIEKDFMSGFLQLTSSDTLNQQIEQVIGRPVDIAQGLDGAIYISDDYSGTIFKVVYVGVGRF